MITDGRPKFAGPSHYPKSKRANLLGLILLLPIYNVWKLQMRTRHKVAVVGLFLLGGFTTITGIIRLHFLTYAFASLRDPLFNDVTCTFPTRYCSSLSLTVILDHYGPVFYWTIIETNTGILSACLPTFRPLFEAYPIGSLMSVLTRPFSSGIRSTMRSSADIRLGSMEQGLNQGHSQALGVASNKAYAVYDDTVHPPETPTGILHHQKYNVSRGNGYEG